MQRPIISVSPHIYSPVDTRLMMKGVLKALIPVFIASIWFFRLRAVWLIVTAVAACVLTEYLVRKLARKKMRLDDYSAVVTALLFALVLPPSIPLWMVFLGGVFAVIFGKEIFGGLGHNIFNPALLARAFLMAAFPVALTTWVHPITLDAVTGATPLGLAKFNFQGTPYLNLLIGNVSGSLGETSALALLLALAYLLYFKIIDYRVPLAFVGSVAAFATVAYLADPAKIQPPLFYLLAGGLFIGAFFMATDPVTTPITPLGRWVFGIGCALITMIIRLWSGLPEGVMYSILLMNALTPLINRMTGPKRFGGENNKKK